MKKHTTGPIKDFSIGIYDGPHATPKESDTGPIFLGIKNVTSDGRLNLSEIRRVSDQEFVKWTRRVVPQKDDIVFSYEATLHRYAIIPSNFKGCLGRRMALVRPNKRKVEPRFLYYYLLSPQWRALIEANIISGATVDRVPIKNFPDFQVSIPDLPTQRATANILSSYDDLIENNRRRMALLEQSARLLYREWFVRLRFPGHERVKIKDGVPEGWERGTLSDLGKIVTGKTPSKKNSSFYGDYIPFIKTPDMHGNIIVIHTEESLSEEGANSQALKTLPARSILVSCIGTVGVVSFNASTAQTNQQINAIVPKSEIVRYWAFFAAQGLKPSLEGMGGGSTMANVNKSKFSGIKIYIPPKPLLAQFNSYVASQIDQIE